MIRRYLVAQLFHETHGFNPVVTTAGDMPVLRGTAVVEKARGSGTTLGGIVGKLTSLGHRIVPILACFGRPSGPVDHHFYEAIRDEIVERASREGVDAVALDLHGAMATTRIDDVEGDLLTRLRATVGASIPIGIGLDMHGHLTTAMLRAADIVIACKECPHIDFPETGARVIECLEAMLDGILRPVRTMAKAPMITLDSGLTACGPLAEVKAKAEALARSDPAIWDISLLQVYRFSDYAEEKGQTALVLANDAPQVAAPIAEALARWFWDNRERFREDALSIDEALDLVARNPGGRPYVLGDLGDRTLAGAPGDSPAILRAALARDDGLRGAVPLTDPRAAEAAWAAGVGASLEIEIGGTRTPGFEPLAVTGVVRHLSEGAFTIEGPVFEGEAESLGRCAVIEVDARLQVLLMSRPGLTHTPSAFTSQGIDVRDQDFIVAKSGQHFQANFAGVATPILVETPGLCHPAKGFFPWKGQPFWPEHEIRNPIIRAQTFSSSPASCP